MEINKLIKRLINKITNYILGYDHIDLPLTDREVELKELKKQSLKRRKI